MARLVTTLKLLEPIAVDGRSIGALRLREPRAREFVVVGPIELVHRKAGLVVRLDIPGRISAYLPVCIENIDAARIGPMLEGMGLADAMRLKAAVARFFFAVSAADIDAYTAILAFDWKLMSLDEADDLGLSELAYTCRRLAEHCKRRAHVQSQGARA